jgi:hypothetical protein
MKKILFLLSALMLAAVVVPAQPKGKNDAKKAVSENASKAETSPIELARAVLKVHGGDNLKNAKSVVIRGSAEVSPPNSAQTLPAVFSITYAGEKYRFEIQAPPVINFLQVFDGQQTFSSLRGFMLPPVNRIGLPLLAYIDEKDFTVSALPEKLKKKQGFRITSPEGFYTDFIIDGKTFQVKEFESAYEANGQMVTTSVAVDKYRSVENILVNEKFSQRINFGQITAYVNFKTKEILVNSELADDVFAAPNR